MGQPHKHAELIKAWAENQSIVVQTKDATGQWVDCSRPNWFDVSEYRIKPEPPKYPQTKLTDDELLNAFEQCGAANIDRARFIANAAIAHAIEDGQVIPLDEHVKEMGDAYLQGNDAGRKDMVPAAMLEEVARDAAAYGYNQAGGHVGLYLGSDFYDLIAKVKEGK